MKIVDIHTHIGLSIPRFQRGLYPFSQGILDLLGKMERAKISYAAAFPFGAPISQQKIAKIDGTPYAYENRSLLMQVQKFGKGKILPFVAFDSKNQTDAQIRMIKKLSSNSTIFGIKIHTKATKTSASSLQGSAILELAEKLDIPIIFHTGQSGFSEPVEVLDLAVSNPKVRFGVAHAAIFKRAFFKRLKEKKLKNIFIDTGPFSVLCNKKSLLPKKQRLILPFSDPRRALRQFAEQFGEWLMFGTDEPFSSFFDPEKKVLVESSMVQEVSYLNNLPHSLRRKLSFENAERFLGKKLQD